MEKVYRLTKEEFKKLKTAWRALSENKLIKPEDIVVYNFLREKSPDSGFVEVVNPRRIKGCDPLYAFHETWYKLYRYSSGPLKSKPLLEQNRKAFEDRYGIPYPNYLDKDIRNLHSIGSEYL